MTVSNQEIKNVELNDVPKYQESLSGLEYIQRLSGKRDVKQLLLKIGDTRELEIEIEDAGFGNFIGSTTINHSQKVAPLVMGDLRIDDEYFPIPYVDSTGTYYFTFSKITEDEIKIYLKFNKVGTAKLKLYLLREKIA